MTRGANYSLVTMDEHKIVLQDLGPWDRYMTITNAVELVISNLREEIKGRRLFYYDSEGELTEILIKDDQFNGFKAAQEIRGGDTG